MWKYHIFKRKQISRNVIRKRCSETMQQLYRRTPMPKCHFEITLRHGCSPVNLAHIFRTSFPRNTSGWLLLFKIDIGIVLNIIYVLLLSNLLHFFNGVDKRNIKTFIWQYEFWLWFFCMYSQFRSSISFCGIHFFSAFIENRIQNRETYLENR